MASPCNVCVCGRSFNSYEALMGHNKAHPDLFKQTVKDAVDRVHEEEVLGNIRFEPNENQHFEGGEYVVVITCERVTKILQKAVKKVNREAAQKNIRFLRGQNEQIRVEYKIRYFDLNQRPVGIYFAEEAPDLN